MSVLEPALSLARPDDDTGRKNMLQLIQLRWIAVVGQVLTIVATRAILHIALPILAMAVVLGFLIVLNIGGHLRLRSRRRVRNSELLAALLLDVAALTAQLYLSGGATNPFISLYLLQVTISAVLLESWSTWAVVGLAGLGFCALTIFFHPLVLPTGGLAVLFHLHIYGMLACFLLDAALVVVFINRISGNLRLRDARLAALRQQAAEEGHIIRMGLLASGAAHELGTPLATLSVILNDWRRVPALMSNAEFAQELADMEGEVQRCKTIVTQILTSAGEARGEGADVTTVKAFLDEVVGDWRSRRLVGEMVYDRAFAEDVVIVADTALKQVIYNVLDNAAEASPQWVGLWAGRHDHDLKLVIRDRGGGFKSDVLSQLGKPYQSTKGRRGGGLGLFLVVNVLRKLGGQVEAGNTADGAVVTLTLPLAALAIGNGHNAS